MTFAADYNAARLDAHRDWVDYDYDPPELELADRFDREDHR